MRLLMIHAECFAYEAKVKTPIAVEVDEAGRAREFDEVLLVLYSTEGVDEEDPAVVAKKGAQEILSYMSKIGRKKIVLFPFAFLVGRGEKSSSGTAKDMEERLKIALEMPELDVVPFGWYKKFSITSMGHKYTVHSARVTPS